MKKRYSSGLLIIFLLLIQSAFAGSVLGGKDSHEISYIKESKTNIHAFVQQELIRGTNWREFSQRNGSWYVVFNEATGKPHRASGQPVSVFGTTPEEVAKSFIQTQLSSWIPSAYILQLKSSTFSGKYYNVIFKQQWNGLDVINSSVFVKLTLDFKVITFGIDAFDLNISSSPTISPSQATINASNGLTGIQQTTDAVLKVLPITNGRNVEQHLVYAVTVSTVDENRIPAKYYTLVDANNGTVLYRSDQVKFVSAVDANVKATVYTAHPYLPSSVQPLRNLKVVTGGNTSYTDSNGNVNLSGAAPVNADFSLEGLWSKTVTTSGTTSPLVSSILTGADTVSFDAATSIRHTSGYYHVNIIHDFMKTFFGTFTGLDFPLPTRIDITSGTCNAFYSGADINFYATGGGCNCMSQIADVVYHEYGHGISDLFYQDNGASFDNGGMGEGYSDVWAIALTQNPVLGIGYDSSDPSAYIRRYDINRKVYPQDLTGEVHDDGEIIAGAWYDVSLNVNSMSTMMQLFTETYYDLLTAPDGAEGQLYTDILIAALNADDNDGDLSNGTPNDIAILDAFALHGITLGNSIAVLHNPLFSSIAAQPIDINSNLNLLFPWLQVSQLLNYRIGNSGPYTTIPFVSAGNTFTATIPAQPEGTIISYFITVIDSSGSVIQVLPKEANATNPNIPYFILVGYDRLQIEDFDQNQSPGWLTGISGDNATTGIWLIGRPTVSLVSAGDTCQPGVQYTVGGTNCAVTGNAPSSSSAIGTNDIDGGRTTLQSPVFNIESFIDPVITYERWYTNDQGSTPRTDFWQTYVSGDGINYVRIENIDVPDHSWRRFVFKVRDYLPTATEVTIRFAAEDANAGSLVEAALDEVEFYDLSTAVSIPTITQQSGLILYPNPASELLTVRFNAAQMKSGNVTIYNSMGQLVYLQSIQTTTGMNQFVLPISSVSNGLYKVVITSGDGTTLTGTVGVVR